MKLLVTCLIFCFALTSIFAQNPIGAGLIIGSDTNLDYEKFEYKMGYGAQIKYQYKLSEKFVVSPNISYFLPSFSEDKKVSLTYLEASIDIQYDLIDNEFNRGYVFVAPVYNGLIFKYPTDGEETTFTLNRFGGVLGFGVEQSSHFYQEVVFQYKPKADPLLHKELFQVYLRAGYLFGIKKKSVETDPVEM